jgi:hypothetical protein
VHIGNQPHPSCGKLRGFQQPGAYERPLAI